MGVYVEGMVMGLEVSQAPDARQSALAFTEGVRAGWLTSDLLAWAREHLIGPRRLITAQSMELRQVSEHDFGTVALVAAHPTRPGRARCLTMSQVPHLLTLARVRVIEALRSSIGGQDSYVHAALYSGRVVRDNTNEGRAYWRVALKEDGALSDQVLALFAADALENSADYQHELAVCDACGAVTIGLQGISSRRGCIAQPFGVADSRGRRTLTTPRGTSISS